MTGAEHPAATLKCSVIEPPTFPYWRINPMPTTLDIINQILDTYLVTASVTGRPCLTANNRVVAMLDDETSVRTFVERHYGPCIEDADIEQIVNEVMV